MDATMLKSETSIGEPKTSKLILCGTYRDRYYAHFVTERLGGISGAPLFCFVNGRSGELGSVPMLIFLCFSGTRK